MMTVISSPIAYQLFKNSNSKLRRQLSITAVVGNCWRSLHAVVGAAVLTMNHY